MSNSGGSISTSGFQEFFGRFEPKVAQSQKQYGEILTSARFRGTIQTTWGQPRSAVLRIFQIPPHTSRKRAAAASAVISRCGDPSISNPTMNFRIVAERNSGG
jgi:hypothetical protein